LIAWGVCAGAAAVLVVAWWIFHCSYRPQHAGDGEGALTVRHLIERVEAETSSGRHRLREPIKSRGDLADDSTDDETQTFVWPSEVWTANQPECARTPLVLRRILTGLRYL
jgi:hypothetical protein